MCKYDVIHKTESTHRQTNTHTASLFISSGDTWPKTDLNPNLPDPILTLTDTEEGILQTGDVVR